MKRNRLVLIVLFLIFPLIKIFATPQAPDKLIYKGDTLAIFSHPLVQLDNYLSLKPQFFGEKEGCRSTDCWKGYQVEWLIDDNQLYLTGIFSRCFNEDGIKADLNELFGSKFIDGKVKADWFVGDIVANQGKLLTVLGYKFIYEKELEMQFDKGQLIETKKYVNSKVERAVYSRKLEE